MATIQEMMLENMDAAARLSKLQPRCLPAIRSKATSDTKNDKDWIRIELTAGMLYTISLSGAEEGGSNGHHPEALQIPRAA